ncbi:hypothetical protein IEQ34_010838 [Dendrobium chrysotoxum]|uniref:glycerophosphodiester phosphodiesterase n=1 Tax=Dendrobium chrysotoxum TaxID=161865 RepID=A0AAV7GY58_DENCH|nr:hypothetical protein IEQ34_010838 [Dendrobium chrysotoxum]
MDAYRIAIQSHVDCIEIDVSRSLDGTLFALHDRDLQRMLGNSTAKVGFMSTNEINKLEADFKLGLGSSEHKIPTIHEALAFVSGSVKQVVLDVKVGPPSFEKDLAMDVLSVVQRSDCKNCLIWAKSDVVVHNIMNLKEDAKVGYIVLKDSVTGATSNLLRMKNAVVVGVYHPLIDKRLVQILHGHLVFFLCSEVLSLRFYILLTIHHPRFSQIHNPSIAVVAIFNLLDTRRSFPIPM